MVRRASIHRSHLYWGTACACAVLGLAAADARADELKLRDGTKITGKIVGYEGDSFKVETSYGFALVRKDKVAQILISEEKPPAKKEPPAPPAPATPIPRPAAATPAPTPPPASANAAGNMAANAASSPPAPAAAAPPAKKAAAPEPIREEVEGTRYTNHTYGFRMYKPPSWHVIADARRALPTAVAAMGTDDETTLFIVGREVARGTLEAQAAQVERRLREIYENYRVTEEERRNVAGMPAIQKKFRGMANEKDWSATLLIFLRSADASGRGGELYTILAMTTSESDLIQIQENVIARTIASLEFIR